MPVADDSDAGSMTSPNGAGKKARRMFSGKADGVHDARVHGERAIQESNPWE